MTAEEFIDFLDKKRGSKAWSEDLLLLAQAFDMYVELKTKEDKERISNLQVKFGTEIAKNVALTGWLEQAKENDMREYEYWTGARWQILSPLTMTIRRKVSAPAE